MNKTGIIDSGAAEKAGEEMFSLIAELYPVCRSITGDGFRQTMDRLLRYVPLEIREVPSGTKVFDWVVPKEWNIKDAWIKDPKGRKIADFRKSNLHVLNYSMPVHKAVSLEELKEHLFTIPDRPDWVPYKTSYYRENWGFCVTHRQFLELEEGEYEALVESTLEDGSLTYGEFYLRGESEDEILVSCHACHPSLANDNLSGVSLSIFLARTIAFAPRRFSYRFLFIPGTIGAITWLSLNESTADRIRHGLVISGVGDAGAMTYKRSRRGNAEIDRAMIHVLKTSGHPYEIRDFHPYGYDERQYCSPGFNLPVGRISRTPFGEYPEYHTSADNLEFVHPGSLGDSFRKVLETINLLENNRTYLNLNSRCEPQLGKRGLYSGPGKKELALLWVLNLSDGRHSLLDIAERSGMEFGAIQEAAQLLARESLLREALSPREMP